MANIHQRLISDPITVKEYCLYQTDLHQLCVIRECGWIVEVVWIDREDLFRMSRSSEEMIVVETSTGELLISNNRGGETKVPCLYIDAKTVIKKDERNHVNS